MSGASVSSFGSAAEGSVAGGLRPPNGLNPGEDDHIFEEPHTIQLGVFGVLYTVSKEKQLTSVKFAFFRLFLDFLQLWLLVINPNYGWDINGKNKAWQVVSFIQLNQFLSARGYSFFLALLYVLVGLLGVNVTLSVWVAHSFSQNRFEYVWPIQFLRWFGLIFYQVLDIATLTLLLVTLDCNYFDVPASLQFHNQEFPGIMCWSMPHIVHVAVSVASIVLFIIMATCMVVSEMELNPLTRNYMAVSHTRVEGYGFAIKTILTIASVGLGTNVKWLSVVYILLNAILFYLYVKWVPFIYSALNYVRCASYGCVLYCSVLLVVLAFGPSSRGDPKSLEFREHVTWAMWAGMAPAAIASALLCHLRLRHFSKHVMSCFRDAEAGANSKAIYRFSDAREVEITARCCRKWVDDDTLEAEAVALSEQVIKAGMIQLPQDPQMIILYSSFLIDVQGSYQSGYTQLQTAKKQSPGLLERFAIFSREQEHTQKASGASNGDAAVDLVSYVEFQRNHRLVVKAHREALLAMRAFWGQLLRTNVDFNNLSKALHRIEVSVHAAERAYRGVLARHGSTARLVRLYGRFLETVKFDPWAASKWYTEADRLEEEQEHTKEALQLGGVETLLPPQGGGTDRGLTEMEGVAIICINAQGTIQVASPEAHALLGYSKNELKGKDVGIIMPAPFGDRHTAYVRNYIHNGTSVMLDRTIEVVVITKARKLMPVKMHVSKVSGLNEDSVFLGVLEPVQSCPDEARAWVLGNGAVIAADERFCDWLGHAAADVSGMQVEDLVIERDTMKEAVKSFARMLPTLRHPHRGAHRRSSNLGDLLGQQPSPIIGEKYEKFERLNTKHDISKHGGNEHTNGGAGAGAPGGGGAGGGGPGGVVGKIGGHMAQDFKSWLRRASFVDHGNSTQPPPGTSPLHPSSGEASMPMPLLLPRIAWRHKYNDPLGFDTSIRPGAIGSVKVHSIFLRRCGTQLPGGGSSPFPFRRPSFVPSALALALPAPTYHDMLLVADHKGHVLHATAPLAAALGRTLEAVRAGGLGLLIPEPASILHGPWVHELSNPQSSMGAPPTHSCRSGVAVSLSTYNEQTGPGVKQFRVAVKQRLAEGGGSKYHVVSFKPLTLEQAISERRLALTLDLAGNILSADENTPSELFGADPRVLVGSSISQLVDLFQPDALLDEALYGIRASTASGFAGGANGGTFMPSSGATVPGAGGGRGVGGAAGGGATLQEEEDVLEDAAAMFQAARNRRITRALLELARRASQTPGCSWRVGVTLPPDETAREELEALARMVGPEDTQLAAQLLGAKTVPAVMTIRIVRKPRQPAAAAVPAGIPGVFPMPLPVLDGKSGGGGVGGTSVRQRVQGSGPSGTAAGTQAQVPPPPVVLRSPLALGGGNSGSSGGEPPLTPDASVPFAPRRVGVSAAAVAEASELGVADAEVEAAWLRSGGWAPGHGRAAGPVAEATEAEATGEGVSLDDEDVAVLKELAGVMDAAGSKLPTQPSTLALAPTAAAPPAPPALAGAAALAAAVAAVADRSQGGAGMRTRTSDPLRSAAAPSRRTISNLHSQQQQQQPGSQDPSASQLILPAPAPMPPATIAGGVAIGAAPTTPPAAATAAAATTAPLPLTPQPPSLQAPCSPLPPRPPLSPPPPQPQPPQQQPAAASANPSPRPSAVAADRSDPPSRPALTIASRQLVSLRLPPDEGGAATAAAAAAMPAAAVPAFAPSLVLEVELWRADLLSGVLEVDEKGKVLRADATCPLGKAGLVLGTPATTLVGGSLGELMPLPAGGMAALLDPGGTDTSGVRGALKKHHSTRQTRPGVTTVLTVRHQSDSCAMELQVQAVRRSGPHGSAYLLVRPSVPVTVPPGFMRWLYDNDASGLMRRVTNYGAAPRTTQQGLLPGAGRASLGGNTVFGSPAGGPTPGGAKSAMVSRAVSLDGVGFGGQAANAPLDLTPRKAATFSNITIDVAGSPLPVAPQAQGRTSPRTNLAAVLAAAAAGPPPPPPPQVLGAQLPFDSVLSPMRVAALRAGNANGGSAAAGAPSRLSVISLAEPSAGDSPDSAVSAAADTAAAAPPGGDAIATTRRATDPSMLVSNTSLDTAYEPPRGGGSYRAKDSRNSLDVVRQTSGPALRADGMLSPEDMGPSPRQSATLMMRGAAGVNADLSFAHPSPQRNKAADARHNMVHSWVQEHLSENGKSTAVFDGAVAAKVFTMPTPASPEPDRMEGGSEGSGRDMDVMSLDQEGDRRSSDDGHGDDLPDKGDAGGGSDGHGEDDGMESEAGAVVANYSVGKRFKKLHKILMSPLAQQPARVLRWHAMVAVVLMMAAHTATFVFLLTRLTKQQTSVADLNSVAMASRRVHEIAINSCLLARMYQGDSYVPDLIQFGDPLNDTITATYEDLFEMTNSLKTLHHGVYLGFHSLKRITAKYDLRDLWEQPVLNVTVFYDPNDPSAAASWANSSIFSDQLAAFNVKMGLWDTGNLYLTKALDLYNNGPYLTAQGANFSAWSSFRFIEANGASVIFPAYQTTLDALVQLTVADSRNIYNLQLIVLCLEGALLCLLACIYMWIIASRFSNKRYSLYGVFIQIPLGVTRGLANMSLKLEPMDDEEEDEAALQATEVPDGGGGNAGGGEGGVVLLTDGVVKAAAADNGSSNKRSSSRTDIPGEGRRQINALSFAVKGMMGGGGGADDDDAPPRPSGGGGGDGGSGSGRGGGGGSSKLTALSSMVASLAIWRSRAKVSPSAATVLTGKAKRQLVHSHRLAYALVAPFILWGAAVIVVNLVGYYNLQSLTAPIATLNIVNAVLVRFHRTIYFVLEVASAMSAVATEYFKTLLTEELDIWKLEYAAMLYGNQIVPNSTSPHFRLAKTGVVFGGFSRPADLLYHTQACLSADPAGCQPPDSPYYQVTRNGLDVLLKTHFSYMESLLLQPTGLSGLNSTEFRFLWGTAQTDVEGGVSRMSQLYLDEVQSAYKRVETQQIVMFCIAWVWGLAFLILQLRPLLHKAHSEMRRIAELLSQLPGEVDCEALVTAVILGERGAAMPAKQSGGVGSRIGRTSEAGGMSTGALAKRRANSISGAMHVGKDE